MINLNKRIKLTSIILTAVLVINLFSYICFADNTDSKKIVVSLGDSYSSGEGIEPFYGQENDLSVKVADPDWLAHRSEQAWSGQLSVPGIGLLSEHRNENWFFVASSGAETKHLITPQEKEYSKLSYSGKAYIPAQLEIFEKLDGQDPDYVTLTLGGNDVGFVETIVEAAKTDTYTNPCYLPDKLMLALDKVREGGEIRNNIKEAYHNIANCSGSQTNIIVAGYPKLFDSDGGMYGVFSKSEAKMINSCVSIFNNVIEEIVYECVNEDGMNIYFVSVEDAFDGHGAYSNDEYINGVIPLWKPEDLKDFQLFSAYSMHPNEKGARVYADCVQAKIDEIEAKTINGSSHAGDISNSIDNLNMKDVFRDFLRDNYENADRYDNGFPVHYHDAPDNSGETWMWYAIDDFDSDGQEELIVHKSFYENEYSTTALQGLFFYEYKNNNVELEYDAYFLGEMVLDPNFLIFYDNGQVYMERELKSLTIFVFNESMRQEFNIGVGDKIVYTVEDYNDMTIRRSIGGGYAYTTYEIISNETYSREKNQLLSGNILNTTMLPVNKTTLW